MEVIRYLQVQFKNNSYFILFFFIGLFLNLNLSYIDVCERVTINRTASTSSVKVNPIVTVSQTQNNGKKLIRPRYYSTELGIREKLFVGVLTSVDQLDYRTVAINRTIAHLSDKVKFFMSVSHKYKLTNGLGNIVGFTDVRETLRPFHIVKYISDSFGQTYDYYFLMKDSTYLNVHLLKYIVNKISVSQDVYLGTRVTDGSFCSLDAGILISNSVLTSMRNNLEWCVKNAFSDNHSDNLGRCVAHSIGLECQEELQGQNLPSFRLKYYNIGKNLKSLSEKSAFNEAAVVFPVSNPEDIYTLHAYRCRLSASRSLIQSKDLSKLIEEIKPNLPAEFMEISWPVGHRPGNFPATRFDVARRSYFNETHKLFRSDYSNIDKLTASEYEDIQRVLKLVREKAHYESDNMLKYRRLVNGYSVFDLSRGLDYILDIGFKDKNTGKEIIKRYQVCKPLGKVEILPMPYVTENKRITLLIPIYETDIHFVNKFMEMYSKNIINRNQKTLVMFALLYENNSTSKGNNDIFLSVKNLALKVSNANYQTPDSNKIAWISIRLPEKYEKNDGIISLACVDLALKKIGLDRLVLLVDLHVEMNVEFLNRVRMNTIKSWQVFNVIPFRQYHPALSGVERLQVHKTTGQFDAKHYGYISFYGRDYVNARLVGEQKVPIVRSDKDVQDLLTKDFLEDWDVFSIFVHFGESIHCMRATDPGIKIKYYDRKQKKMLGTKAQLAKLILTYGSLDF